MIHLRFVIMWALKILMWGSIASLVYLVFSCEEFCEEPNRTAVVVNFYSLENDALTPVTVGIRGIENDSVLYQEVTFINSSGLLTVAPGETAASITVTAISVFDGTKTGSATVTLSTTPVMPAVTSIVVSPGTATVRQGNEQQFTAAVETQGGAPTDVTWSVSGNMLPATDINSSGLLIVASGETAETLTVMATSVFDGTKTGIATVTVSDAPVMPAVVSVVVSPGTATVRQGNGQQFTAAVETQGGAPADVIWSVSGNMLPATDINSSGLLTVASGETAETLTVTATSVFDDTKTGIATVTISDEPVTPAVISVTVSPRTATVQKGKTLQFTAAVETQGEVPANVIWKVSGNTLPAACSQVLLPVNPNADFMSFTIYNANDTLPADIIGIHYVRHIGFISSECGCAAFAEIQDEPQATKHSIKDIKVINPNVTTVSYRQGVINAENIRIYY